MPIIRASTLFQRAPNWPKNSACASESFTGSESHVCSSDENVSVAAENSLAGV